MGEALTFVAPRYTLNATFCGSPPSRRQLTRLPLPDRTLITPRSRRSTCLRPVGLRVLGCGGGCRGACRGGRGGRGGGVDTARARGAVERERRRHADHVAGHRAVEA